EEQPVGVAGEAVPDVEPALLPAGQAAHPLVAFLGETDDLEHLVERARVRVEAAVELDRLRRGQVLVEAGRLEHDPDPGSQPAIGARGIEAEHRYLSGG